MRGTADRVMSRRYLDIFDRWISNSTVHEFAGAGHMAPLEQPAEFLDAVTSFLT